jgi:hypothetical protein
MMKTPHGVDEAKNDFLAVSLCEIARSAEWYKQMRLDLFRSRVADEQKGTRKQVLVAVGFYCIRYLFSGD